MRLAYVLTATDMRICENDVTLGIHKSSYITTDSSLNISKLIFEKKNLTLIAPITTAADDKFATSFPIFDKNKV